MMGERLAQHMFPTAGSISFLSLGTFVLPLRYDDAGWQIYEKNHGNKFMPEGRMRTPTTSRIFIGRLTGEFDRLSTCVHLHTDLRRPMHGVGLLYDLTLLPYDMAGNCPFRMAQPRCVETWDLYQARVPPLCLLVRAATFLKLSSHPKGRKFFHFALVGPERQSSACLLANSDMVAQLTEMIWRSAKLSLCFRWGLSHFAGVRPSPLATTRGNGPKPFTQPEVFSLDVWKARTSLLWLCVRLLSNTLQADKRSPLVVASWLQCADKRGPGDLASAI
jgi:hypothetical protein